MLPSGAPTPGPRRLMWLAVFTTADTEAHALLKGLGFHAELAEAAEEAKLCGLCELCVIQHSKRTMEECLVM